MTTALTDNRSLAKTASDECSPGLWRLLNHSNVTFTAAVEEVAKSADRSELEAVATRLEQHAAGCGDTAVIAALTPLVTLYGITDRSETEWRTFWRFYIDALGDLPAEAVRAGVNDYVQSAKSEFFPKPGPLKALCEERAAPIRRAASRASRALSYLETGSVWSSPKPDLLEGVA
jgi:hypothetical protein